VRYAVEYSKTETVFQRVVDSAPPAEVYHTDGNLTYLAVLFPGRHTRNAFDKSDTHDVESVNADLRTYIAGLSRRTHCFFRSLETIQAVMATFVNAYNKFGEAKQKRAVTVNHRSDPTGRHLHKTRDLMLAPKDFL
jgi:IS1 family transposase